MTKISVTVPLEQIQIRDQPLTDFLAYLAAFNEQYSEYTALTLRQDFHGYNGEFDLWLDGERLETDNELEERLDCLRAAQAKELIMAKKKLAKLQREVNALKKKVGEE